MSDEGEQRPRGLWSVMRGPEPADEDSAARPAASDPVTEDAEAETGAAATELKGLWSVMRSEPQTEAGPDAHEPQEAPAAPADAAGTFVPAALVESGIGRQSWPASASPREAAASASRTRSRGAVLSLLLGLAAVPLAALALLPDFYLKFPAMTVGFLALALGMTAASEIRRSRGGRAGLLAAIAGMTLGTVGMFLGPMVFVPLGRQWRAASGRQWTRRHLEEIGFGMAAYHEQHGRFPPAEVAGPAGGEDVPLHAWPTALLPFLGEESRHRAVDFARPWDAASNYEPLRAELTVLYAGGVETRTVVVGGRKYGVAHFAGVGGPGDAGTGFAGIGIFDGTAAVTRDDVSDGLSQTLIVGEIGHEQNFRPWAEPGNLRTIGRGLNRELSGFGNAARTGATFLHADGSVKFYGNNVSPEVLRRLSTRDGAD